MSTPRGRGRDIVDGFSYASTAMTAQPDRPPRPDITPGIPATRAATNVNCSASTAIYLATQAATSAQVVSFALKAIINQTPVRRDVFSVRKGRRAFRTEHRAKTGTLTTFLFLSLQYADEFDEPYLRSAAGRYRIGPPQTAIIDPDYTSHCVECPAGRFSRARASYCSYCECLPYFSSHAINHAGGSGEAAAAASPTCTLCPAGEVPTADKSDCEVGFVSRSIRVIFFP